MSVKVMTVKHILCVLFAIVYTSFLTEGDHLFSNQM